MAIVLGPSNLVTLVSDAGTPTNLTGFAGVRLVWPQGLQMPTPGVRDVLQVTVGQSSYTIPGYLRTSNGNEWVMQAAEDPIVVALNAIPGADGWQSAPAKAVYANIGQQMLDQGFTLTTTQNVLTQLYQAAVGNHVTAHP